MTSPGTYRLNSPGPESASPAVSHGIRVLDLAAETGSIASAHDPERTARTLARLDTLRLTLMRLKAGSTVKQHHTDHELSIHTVFGRIAIQTPEGLFELPQGHVAILDRGVIHDIQAKEESAILVTVGVSHRHDDKAKESLSELLPPAED